MTKTPTIWRRSFRFRVFYVAAVVVALGGRAGDARAQTPSPLQEWQYSAGVDLIKLFVPVIRVWRIDMGVAADYRPLYEGAKNYRVLGGPVIDIRYQDLAFFSIGEGIGVNLIRDVNYRAGISIGYDLGRRDEQALTHLAGLSDVGRAPVIKLFSDYVIPKEWPLVLRVDASKIIGGARAGLETSMRICHYPEAPKRSSCSRLAPPCNWLIGSTCKRYLASSTINR